MDASLEVDAPPAKVGDRIDSIPTPFLLVDADRLEANIEAMQRRADRGGALLHPHVKTHKCTAIADLQVRRGASGLTAAKLSEAAALLTSGPCMTIAYPLLDPTRIARFLRAAPDRHVRLVVDSEPSVAAAAQAAADADRRIEIFIEIDVGLNRCGVDAHSPALMEIASRVARSPNLDLIGVFSHAGHAYAASGRDEVESIAHAEAGLVRQAAERIAPFLAGPGPQLSVGSTPTVLAAGALEGITELRPGNYVFLDQTAVRLGVATQHDIALSIVSTVVSQNSRFHVVDAGSKVLSSDLAPHSVSTTGGFGIAVTENGLSLPVVALSEEHGRIARGDDSLRIGDRLRLLPNHSCPAVNLADWLVVARGDRVEAVWRIEARGAVR